MVHSHASIKESYSILGLSEDASLETVRSTYKRIALRTHPDKNPNNPNATQEFQQVSDAYNVLLQHLDPSNPAAEEYEWMEEEYDSEDEYFAHAKMDFYMFLFEELFMRGAYRTQTNSRRGGYQRQRQAPGETPAEYQERLRRSRADQIAAEQRRKEEAAARKLRNEQERERERVDAEQRRLDAIKAKKAQGEKERQDAAAIVTKARQKAQTKRSTVFAAARSGLVEKVKKGVWEDEVDPSGGEVQPGCEKFVNKMPNDPTETLLHIAVQCGSLDLVEWLQSHNADSAEARNAEGLTPFHIAVRLGHIHIMNYFFENHDPKDEDSEGVYSAPESTATLHLAVLSHEPEVVYMILNNSLASNEEIGTSWSWITSSEGRHTMSQKVDHRKPTELEKFNDILKLLMRFGGFTPPPTPNLSEEPRASKSSKKPYKPNHQRAQSSTVEDIGDRPSSQSSYRGRGGARGRARGRGRGRGQAPVTVPV